MKKEEIYYKNVPWDDVMEICNSLENYHKLFYTFFEYSSVCYTNRVPTAAVRFKPSGKPELLLGEKFWKSKGKDEQTFIIMHENMHVFCDHGNRNGKDVLGSTPYLVNIAQDITNNEMIYHLFGFDRNLLDDWKKYCWISTCFDDPSIIKRNESFTYYLEMLIKYPSAAVKNGTQTTMDEHDPVYDDNITEEQIDQFRKKFAGTLANEMTVEEIEKIKNSLPKSSGESPGAGSMSGNYEVIISKKTEPVKLKIAKLIQNLKGRAVKMVQHDIETFVRKDRRFISFTSKNPNTHLPGSSTILREKKEKLLVALYTDISGSCISYIPFFKRILNSFLLEKATMDVIAHTFDTRVNRVEYNTKIAGGGGTFFHIIEEQNKILEKEIGRYPDCVIVITDGDGNNFQPTFPARWIWLLTPNSTTSYIHPKSKKFNTKDVVIEV